MSDGLLDGAGAADYLKVSERMIRNLVYKRQVPYVKVGKFVRFRREDLDAYAANQLVDVYVVPSPRVRG